MKAFENAGVLCKLFKVLQMHRLLTLFEFAIIHAESWRLCLQFVEFFLIFSIKNFLLKIMYLCLFEIWFYKAENKKSLMCSKRCQIQNIGSFKIPIKVIEDAEFRNMYY